MKILAFDPGTTTGIALVDVEKTTHKLLYAANYKRTPAGYEKLDRLWLDPEEAKIENMMLLDTEERIRETGFIPGIPDLVIVETPKKAWGRKGRVNISNLATGMLRGGILIGQFLRHNEIGDVIQEIDPSEWLIRFAHGNTARAARNDEIWAAFKNLFPEPYEQVKAYHNQMGKGEHSRDAALMAYAIGHEELLKETS